jgi:hypothetical protein
VDYTKNELEIWSMATGELLVRTELPWAPASVSVSPDGQLVAVGGRPGQVEVRRAN